MVAKYKRLIEEREINDKTGSVWAIQNVGKTWRARTEAAVLADGYVFLDDGTAIKAVQ